MSYILQYLSIPLVLPSFPLCRPGISSVDFRTHRYFHFYADFLATFYYAIFLISFFRKINILTLTSTYNFAKDVPVKQ